MPTSQEEAVGEADVVILAVPDAAVGPLAGEIVPSPKAGTMVVTLDPAAAYGGELPEGGVYPAGGGGIYPTS